MLSVDVLATSVDLPGRYAQLGMTIPATLIVYNNGNSSLPVGLSGTLVLTSDRTLGNGDDKVLTTFSGVGLNAGQQKTLDLVGTVPANLGGGAWYVAVRLDPSNLIAETNETNNVSVSTAPLLTIVSAVPATITGTGDNDAINVSSDDLNVYAVVNGTGYASAIDDLDGLRIFGEAGNDKLVADPGTTIPLTISGGGGNDTIIGGDGNDELSGANGSDKIYGVKGDDHLIGGAGSDRLYGGDGADTQSGGGGRDYLYGLAGRNYLIGGAGNDVFDSSGNGAVDTLSGNAGDDFAAFDSFDVRTSIELT